MNKDSWEVKNLKDICHHKNSSIIQNKLINNEGSYSLFGASGFVKKIDFYHQDIEYIGIVKDGSGVGRVTIFPAYSSIVGTMQYIFPKHGYLLRYIAYALKSINLSSYATGIAIPHIYFRDYGNAKLKIYNSLTTQQQIVNELDTLSDIITKKKKQLADLDKLAQATFYDMFGDPINNEKKWPTKNLGELGILKNGLNYNQNENGKTLPFLGVSDFKENKVISNLESVISLDELPQDDYFLNKDDFVFVRSNGSKELVGRCILFKSNINNAVYSGFCIRFRLNSNTVLPLFLLYILTSKQLRESMLQAGRGANISNINQQMLSSLQIIIPSLSLQSLFAEIIEAIEQQKALINQSITDTQLLFDYTMDKYFN